jgi:hypothetical protein
MRLYAEYMRQRQKLEEDKKRSLELYQEKIEKDKQRISKVCKHLDILFNMVLNNIRSMSSINCYYKHLRFLNNTCNIVWINCFARLLIAELHKSCFFLDLGFNSSEIMENNAHARKDSKTIQKLWRTPIYRRSHQKRE